MKLIITLLSIGLLASSLTACQSKQDTSTNEPSAMKNYLKVTFDGKTKTYTDIYLSDEAQLGKITSWEITAGLTSNDYLTLALFGSGGGIYPYKQDINNFSQVSQIDYKTTGNKSYTNYKTIVCPTYSSNYYSTIGQVKLDQYVAGKLAKGTFSGALLEATSFDDCTKESKPFSGEFYIVNP